MRYSTNTKLSTADVLRRATEFFGPDGVGLTPIEEESGALRFEAADGFVEVSASGEGPTEVELVTREYDFDTKRFMARIG